MVLTTQFGNLADKKVCARDVGTDASWPPANRGLSADIVTTYGYSSDGYFRTSETNALGYTSTQTVDSTTGDVLTRREIQGGPLTTFEYDWLGRPLTTTTDGTRPVYHRVLSCSAGPNCLSREQTFQDGAPVKTVYKDRLGRVIASGTESFTGFEIVTKIDYSERGIKLAEYPPIELTTGPGLWNGTAASAYPTTYSGNDIFGRSTSKTVLRKQALFAAGAGDAALTTTYSYSV